MKSIFDRAALFSTAIVTTTVASVGAAAMAVTDGPMLLAPFAAAALGFSYHMGICRGQELASSQNQSKGSKSKDAAAPR